MAEAAHLAKGQPAAVHDAGVVILVGDDKVAPAHQRRDGAQVGLVAGGKDQRRLRAHELGQPPLQFQVQFQRTVEEAGAGATGAVAPYRFDGGLAHLGVRGQAQVVVGTDHDQAVVADGDLGALTVGEGDEIGIEASRLHILGRRVLPTFLEQIHHNILLSLVI